MRIDRAYKGISEKTLVLFDDGMCDGPTLQVGEQYLMYTHRWGRGDVPSRGCTRSRHVKYAEEDLKYLNGLRQAPPTGAVFGQVTVRTDDIRSKEQRATGAAVAIRGEGKTLTTTTDREGRYSFEGLRPAKFSITASLPGFRVSARESDDPETVAPRGCAVIDVVLRKDWPSSIGGRVTWPDGKPAPAGIHLLLIRVEGKGEDEESQPLIREDVRTDAKGMYLFRSVAPGRYKVAMNPYFSPTPKRPIPTIYWPAEGTEETASEVEISGAAVSLGCDFHLPPKPRFTVVRGVVLLPSGKPAGGAVVLIRILPANIGVGDHQPVTDTAGRFSFLAAEGYQYRLTAWKADNGFMDSQDQRFSPGKGPRSITLVLVPRPFR